MMQELDREYLARAFADLLNYDADDVLDPIDPMIYRSPEGDGCLHIAALRGDVKAVRILLDEGADPNLRGDMGNTPLHYAFQKHHAEIVQLLLDKGASANVVNEFDKVPGDNW